jgi:hypothetical protein
MSASPELELRFRAAYAIDEPGEVALEDYVRVLLRAAEAHGVRDRDDPARIVAVRVVEPRLPQSPQALRDAEDFARSLVAATPGGGLGWS